MRPESKEGGCTDALDKMVDTPHMIASFLNSHRSYPSRHATRTPEGECGFLDSGKGWQQQHGIAMSKHILVHRSAVCTSG